MPIIHETDDKGLVESLRSGLCPACLEPKKAGHTFCRLCYIALPARARYRLYDRLGQGYREAVIAAMELLGKTVFTLPPR